jgi:hypothetical protein
VRFSFGLLVIQIRTAIVTIIIITGKSANNVGGFNFRSKKTLSRKASVFPLVFP